MDRLQALRDTANLPRAVTPPPAVSSPVTSGGMKRSLNDSGLDLRMDDSLTDMQWLQRMDAGSEIPGFVQKPLRKRLPKSDKENQRLPKQTKDGCRKRLHYDSTTVGEGGGREGGREAEKATSNKPPLSYASLIVLAISSTPQRMLTLSGIYRWIESTFPFYRTPESKAWKNSIRHNLSIRKNMFTKVHQYPPRRGNGSYWALLSDGEDELARAHPLFTTLLPPVIDPDSVYCRTPLTHTVKSRGQFMPVFPDTNRETPYFALNAPANDGSSPVVTHSLASSPPAHFQEIEVTTATKKQKRVAENCPNKVTASTHHLLEHNYSKTVTFEPELQLVEEELAAEDLVEGSFMPHSSAGMESGQGGFMERGILQVDVCDSTTDIPHTTSSPVTTPTHHDHAHMDSVADCSLTSLLGTSFLTPTKMAAISDLSFDAISFSPLYNFVTPQREGTSPPGQPAVMSSHSGNHGNTLTPNIHENHSTTPLRSENTTFSNTSNETGGIFTRTTDPIPVPVSDQDTTPSHSSSITGIGISELDSGVFSPFSTSLCFSTPLGLKSVSPLMDLPGNVFSTPQSTEHTRNSTPNFGGGGAYHGATPTRKSGSRQLFPLSFSSPTS